MERIVLITDHVHSSIPDALSAMGFSIETRPEISNDELEGMVAKYSGLIISTRTVINKALLDKATNLRFVGRVGSGMEHVDVVACREHGVMCFSSPEGNANAVGEHCLGLLLAILNNIPRSDHEIRDGLWIRENNRGEELDGKTIGIIGYGHTGPAFARKLRGFDTTILVYDKYRLIHQDAGVKQVSLEDIYEQADIISFHVPYTPETHHMLDKKFIGNCRKQVYILNTSRGAIAHTSELVVGLREGKILGLGMDVFEDEPVFSGKIHPPSIYKVMMNHPRVVVTPHIAGWTVQSKLRLAEVLMDKFAAWWNKEMEKMDKE